MRIIDPWCLDLILTPRCPRNRWGCVLNAKLDRLGVLHGCPTPDVEHPSWPYAPFTLGTRMLYYGVKGLGFRVQGRQCAHVM